MSWKQLSLTNSAIFVHIRHRDTLTQAVAATVGGAIAFFAHLLSYSLWFRGFSSRDNNNINPIGLLLMVFLALLAATLIQMTVLLQKLKTNL